VSLCASVLVTMTFTAPAAWAGVVAVIDALLTSVTPVAGVPPKLTVAPARKPVPAIVTLVPPLVVPVLGVIEATWGAGLEGGLGVAAIPPPQPGKNSAKSNREQAGKQYLGDIKKNLSDARVALPVSGGTSETGHGRGTCYPSNVSCLTDLSNFRGPPRLLSGSSISWAKGCTSGTLAPTIEFFEAAKFCPGGVLWQTPWGAYREYVRIDRSRGH
jgi:hypothetical protein